TPASKAHVFTSAWVAPTNSQPRQFGLSLTSEPVASWRHVSAQGNKLGQYHCNNRRYDIRSGRWISPDQAASPFHNLFGYATVRVLQQSDPTGLKSDPPTLTKYKSEADKWLTKARDPDDPTSLCEAMYNVLKMIAKDHQDTGFCGNDDEWGFLEDAMLILAGRNADTDNVNIVKRKEFDPNPTYYDPDWGTKDTGFKEEYRDATGNAVTHIMAYLVLGWKFGVAAKGVGVVREWGEDADRASGCHAAAWGAGLEGVGTGLEDFVDGDFYSEFCVGCTSGAEKVAATKYKAPAIGAGAGKIVEERITAKAEKK
ncbi:MAG: hypothetical protein KBG84_13600, partial [Planctomycetes bacterium]|nr:hypothetical protein [Planctomycetota bacterium]